MRQVKFMLLTAAALIISAGIIESNALASLVFLGVAGVGIVKGRLWRIEDDE